MLVQITAGSLLGDFGRPAQRLAELLVRDGSAHFVASDTHRPIDARTPTIASLTATSPRLTTASAGDSTGSIWRVTPTPTVSRTTALVRSGSTATG